MFENYYFIEKMAKIRKEEILHSINRYGFIPTVKSRRPAQNYRVFLINLWNHIIRSKS